jgi:hypothetical protein
MIGRLERFRPDLRLLVALVSTLLLGLSLGVWVNLLTDELSGRLDFFSAIGELGWRNLLLALMVAAAAPPVFEARRARKAYIEQNAPTLQTVLELTLRSVRALHPPANPNGRYFEFQKDRNRLVRRRHVELIADAMPDDYLFDEVSLDSGLVICDSFTKERPIYKKLGPKDREGYSEEIRKRIPPKIRWVLACPVRREGSATGDARPIGVVCIWGHEPPARNKEEAERLESIAAATADVFTQAIHGYQAVMASNTAAWPRSHRVSPALSDGKAASAPEPAQPRSYPPSWDGALSSHIEGLLVLAVAVAQSPGELAGFVLRPGSENGQVVRHAPTAARHAGQLSISSTHFRERAAPFRRRLYATATAQSRRASTR